MSKLKVKVAQHGNGQWAVFIENGEHSRVYHESGVKSAAVHAAKVLRNAAQRHPELLQVEWERAQ